MFTLEPKTTGLILIDVQEKLFPKIERPVEIMEAMQKMIRGCQIFDIPILVTEQYPEGLGPTIAGLKGYLGNTQEYISKTTFSCLDNEDFRQKIEDSEISHWIVMGLEAHVCILQTVMDLIHDGNQVVVLNDAISSRSIFDYSTAIAEMRDFGARISSVETILFELTRDSKSEQFPQISQLVKEPCGSSCSSC